MLFKLDLGKTVQLDQIRVVDYVLIYKNYPSTFNSKLEEIILYKICRYAFFSIIKYIAKTFIICNALRAFYLPKKILKTF